MKCFKSFLMCISKIWGALDSICLQVMGQFVPLPTNVNSQIAPKMSVMRYPLSSAWQLWYCIIINKERHALLMKCFKPFLRCMRQMEGASNSLIWAPYCSHNAISAEVDSQIAHKIPDFGYPRWNEEGDDGLLGEISIAAEAAHILPYIHKADGRSF